MWEQRSHALLLRSVPAQGRNLGGAGGCSSTPSSKKVCPVILPDPMTFLIGRNLHLHYYEYFRYLTTALSNSPVSDYQLAHLYFKIHTQLTIIEVLSEGTLLISVADIHVNVNTR